MCLPVIAAAINVAARGTDYAQQSVLANAQNKVAKRNREGAVRAARLNYDQIAAAENAEVLRARSAVTNIRREAEAARGNVAAGAADAGVAGQSVEDLYIDFERQEGELVEAALLQESIARYRLEGEREAARLSQEARILSAADTAGPNAISAGLNAAVDGYGAYQGFKLRQNQLDQNS